MSWMSRFLNDCKYCHRDLQDCFLDILSSFHYILFLLSQRGHRCTPAPTQLGCGCSSHIAAFGDGWFWTLCLQLFGRAALRDKHSSSHVVVQQHWHSSQQENGYTGMLQELVAIGGFTTEISSYKVCTDDHNRGSDREIHLVKAKILPPRLYSKFREATQYLKSYFKGKIMCFSLCCWCSIVCFCSTWKTLVELQ